jgi:hypothetical protein
MLRLSPGQWLMLCENLIHEYMNRFKSNVHLYMYFPSLFRHMQRFWGASADFWVRHWESIYVDWFHENHAALFIIGTFHTFCREMVSSFSHGTSSSECDHCSMFRDVHKVMMQGHRLGGRLDEPPSPPPIYLSSTWRV